MQVNDAGVGLFLELVGIDEVVLGMAAAEEQHRRTQVASLRLERGALAQEAAERREARARPDHDDRRRRIDRQAEAHLGLLHEGLHRGAAGLAQQVIGADAVIDARARARRPLDHRHGDGAAIAVGHRRRRDRVVARRHQRQHFEERRERQLAGRMLFQQVEHGLALGQNLGAEALLVEQRLELGPREGAARVLRHGLDLLARRRMLQFDEVRQQAMDGDRLADRQVGAPALGRRQHDMRAGREGEAAQRALDQGGGVLRHDAEMIAGAVADAIGQQHLDVPRAAARGVGASAVRGWPARASAARRCRR